MSNNLTRKGLAVSSGLVLAFASLVAVAPATAAPGDVGIEPTVGSSYSVFNDDSFSYDVQINDPTLIENHILDISDIGDDTYAVLANPELGLRLTNEDAQAFEVTIPAVPFQDDAEDYDAFIAIDYFNADDDSVRVYEQVIEGNSTFAALLDDTFLVDFSTLVNGEDAVAAHIHGFGSWDDSAGGLVGIVEEESDETISFTFDVTPLDEDYNRVSYGDGAFELGVRAWLEVGLIPN